MKAVAGQRIQLARLEPLNFAISGDYAANLLGGVSTGELETTHPKTVVPMIETNNLGALHDQPEWVADGGSGGRAG